MYEKVIFSLQYQAKNETFLTRQNFVVSSFKIDNSTIKYKIVNATFNVILKVTDDYDE